MQAHISVNHCQSVGETWRKITTFTFSTQPSPKKECEIWIQSDFIYPFINLPRVVWVERVVRVEMPSASDPKIKILYYFLNAMVGDYKFFYAGYLTTNKGTCKVSWFPTIAFLKYYRIFILGSEALPPSPPSPPTSLGKFIKGQMKSDWIQISHSFLGDGCFEKVKVIIFLQVSPTASSFKSIS